MTDLTSIDIETWLLFAVLVAGKTESHALRVLRRLVPEGLSPFATVRGLIRAGRLTQALCKARSGSYTRLTRCLRELVKAKLDIKTCSVEELECIHGIGPKTARFFLLKTRPNARVAALDTHILKWLRSLGHKAPRSTPTGKRYRDLERVFLAEADKRGLTPRRLDHIVWSHYARGTKAP